MDMSLARELHVVGTDFAMIYEHNSEGKFSGLGVDIITEFARQNGDSVSFESYPWVRAQTMVEQGQADILMGPYKTPEREKRFSYAAKPFYRDFMVFYVRKNSNMKWDGDYNSLREKKLAVINGWTYGINLESKIVSEHLEKTQSITTGLMMLKAERFDYLASNRRNTEALIKNKNWQTEFISLSQPIETQEGYIAFCKKENCEKLRQQFDPFFKALIASGKFASMVSGYGLTLP